MSNFIDRVKIEVRAGHGGAGCVSFRREAYVPRGGPNGGDGGKGADIVLVADKQLGTLIDLKYQQHYYAEKGEQGRGKEQSGADGEDTIIRVPVGTIVHDAETRAVIVDLDADGLTYIIAKGGRGGKGNAFFKTATNQAPRYAQPGEPGEEQWLFLELKLLADVGLVGFPNAGKSTLIARISAAKPKIADYPFTTLSPVLGVVKPEGRRSFVVADIPGLIENAHKGAGLGFEFLRHVERTSILLHMVDVSGKAVTEREALAEGRVVMARATLDIVRKGDAKKGDVLGTARIAGIMAAKRTHELIPLCHPLSISQVEVDIEPNAALPGIEVKARVKVAGPTGVEMEALTAVAVACLTIYDMVKALERGMRIEGIRLVEKRGGRSGHYRAAE